jgi:hypothetical protein
VGVEPGTVEGFTTEFVTKTLFLSPVTGAVGGEELEPLLQPHKTKAAIAAQIVRTQFRETHFFRRIIPLILCCVGIKA